MSDNVGYFDQKNSNPENPENPAEEHLAGSRVTRLGEFLHIG
jgi:hypothetical protein